MQTFKEFDGLFCGCLVAMDGHGGIDDFFHLPADGAGILDGYRTPDVQIDIIAIGHWDVDSHLTGVEKCVCCLAENEEQKNEEQTAGVGTDATRGGDVEKFHIFGGI